MADVLKFRTLLGRYPELGVAIVLLIVGLYFSLASSSFLTVMSTTSMLTVAAEVGVVAIGVSLLMIGGEFDISVGSVMAVATLVFCELANQGCPALVSLLVTVLACAAIGSINGLITLKLKIPSFIVTLGAMMFWRGLHSYLTDGFPVMYAAEAQQRDAWLLNVLGGNPFAMLHMTVVWFLILALVSHLVLRNTAFGNQLMATGGSADSARNAGVRIQRHKLTCFILCSVFAGMAGVMNLARFKASQGLLGVGIELEAIAACVIGGNVLTGGVGTILGTLLGSILIAVIRTGLIDQGVSPYLYPPLTGVVIVLAVVINTAILRMRK